jgi:predicted transcriptional regulator
LRVGITFLKNFIIALVFPHTYHRSVFTFGNEANTVSLLSKASIGSSTTSATVYTAHRKCISHSPIELSTGLNGPDD